LGKQGDFMTNDTAVFDAMRFDVSAGENVWAGLTGTREAIRRDGYCVDPIFLRFCPHEWLDSQGYVDQDLAQIVRRETETLPQGIGGM
jgi:hypothetical protein